MVREKEVTLMLEKDFQKSLITDLERVGCRCYVYGKKGFMPIDHKKRFDVLVFNEWLGIFGLSPIALELKAKDEFRVISEALYDQIDGLYHDKIFSCEKEKWSGKPKVYALCTHNSIGSGWIYTTHFKEASNFFIDRISSRMKIGVLYRTNGCFWLVYKDKFYDFTTKRSTHVYWNGASRHTVWDLYDKNGNYVG